MANGCCANGKFPPTIDQEVVLVTTERMARKRNAYLANHILDGLWIGDRCDAKTLEKAINHVIKRHSALRSFFLPSPRVSDADRTHRLASNGAA